MNKRRNHVAGFMARVALEAVKGARTASALAVEYCVHPPMINQWKKALLDGAADIFERGGGTAPKVDEDTVRAMHAKIGAAFGQRFSVTTAQALDRRLRHAMIEKNHPRLSVGMQCHLLSIARSSFDHEPQCKTAMNLNLMPLIDQQFLETRSMESGR